MPRKKLTDRFVAGAQALDGKITEYADTVAPGLALRVMPSGVRSWTFRYRTSASKQQRRLPLGRADTVSLKDARAAAIRARMSVVDGLDPVHLRKVERETQSRSEKFETVSAIGIWYFDECARGRHRNPKGGRLKRSSTIASERAYFDKHIAPRFGDERIVDLTRARVDAFIAELEERHSPTAARQSLVVLKAICNFSVSKDILQASPCAKVYGPSFASRKRVLSPDELRTVWLAFGGQKPSSGLAVSHGLGLAVRLAAATLQRRAEVTGIRKAEIDRAAKVWLIPGERAKNHRDHLVPLSDLALSIIEQAWEISGDSEFLFPSPRASNGEDKPITPAAMSHAWRRMAKAASLADTRPHDLRRTGATEMTKESLGVPRFAVSLVLNHASDLGGGAAVTAVYARHDYLDTKRDALNKWAIRLDEIVSASAPTDEGV